MLADGNGWGPSNAANWIPTPTTEVVTYTQVATPSSLPPATPVQWIGQPWYLWVIVAVIGLIGVGLVIKGFFK